MASGKVIIDGALNARFIKKINLDLALSDE